MTAAYDDRDGKIWMDGELVEWRDANVHVLTHALHYASSVFEGERCYNGKIFLLSEDGDTFVVKAGPEFEILHKNSLSEMSLATPAVARGSLILRTQSKLYRIATRP